MAWPATAAVPWPMTRIRAMAPSASRSVMAGGRAAPTRADNRPVWASVKILPRRVLRNDWGASEISFRRKWGKPARSMSRVVISAMRISPGATARGEPS